MSLSPVPSFWIDEWQIEPHHQRISNGQTVRSLEPRIMRVLVCLAEQAGDLVEREVLLDEVWSDVVVNEDALTRAVSDLRKALGDDASASRYIETVRGRGYRLIAPVSDQSIRSDVSREIPPIAGAPAAEPLPKPGHRIDRLPTVVVTVVCCTAVLWMLTRFTGSSTETASLSTRPFTSYVGYEIAPALSPDGRQVAYAWSASFWDEEFDLYLKQDGIETPLRLTDLAGLESSPSWSPDGQTIAFGRYDLDTREAGIYTVSTIGGPPRLLFRTSSWVYGLDWSPDGQQLVYAERAVEDQHAFHITMVSLETLEQTVLTYPPTPLHRDHSPVISPDGQMVAFIRTNPIGRSEVYLVPIVGGATRRLTRLQTRITGIGWTQEGSHLICLTYVPGTSQLWRISVDDGSLTRLPVRLVPSRALSVIDDRLIIQEEHTESDIWRINLSGATASMPARVIASTQWDGEPSPSPDGERIAFVSARSGTMGLWIADRDGQHPYQLVSVDGLPLIRPRWSPDGTHLAFNAIEQGADRLYVVDTSGRLPHRLLDETWHPVVASWSRNGQWIYFASERTGSWQLWKLPARGGRPIQVTTEGGFSAYESIDGTYLYYTKPDTSGLWGQPTDGGQEMRVLDWSVFAKWDSWGITGEGIYFTDRLDNHPVLKLFSPSEDTIRVLARLPDTDWPSGVVVATSIQYILFAKEVMTGSDLVSIEGLR